MNAIRLLILLAGFWTGLAVAPLQAFAHVEPETHMHQMIPDDAHAHDQGGDALSDACSVLCSLACKFMLMAVMYGSADPASEAAVMLGPVWFRVHERNVPIPPPRHEAILNVSDQLSDTRI